MALSDADVQKQITHMMGFIEQEANEKAEEIDAKAEEEFNIEKGRLVQQQRLKIMDYYERKEKQVELQRKIQSSNMLNQARLKVLRAREDHVLSVLDDNRKKICELSKDNSKYPKIIEKLLAQGMCQLLETKVSVRCRQADVGVVEDAIPSAVAVAKSKIGKQISVMIDKKDFLPSECSGGIELYGFNGRIEVDNTLEARLVMISNQMAPHIRSVLFGANKNRKFLD